MTPYDRFKQKIEELEDDRKKLTLKFNEYNEAKLFHDGTFYIQSQFMTKDEAVALANWILDLTEEEIAHD